MGFISEATGLVSDIAGAIGDVGEFVGGLFSPGKQTYEEYKAKYLGNWISRGGTEVTFALAVAYNFPQMPGIPSAAVGRWSPGMGISLFPNSDRSVVYSSVPGSGISGGKWSGSEIPGYSQDFYTSQTTGLGGIAGGLANSLDTSQGDVIADAINRFLGRATQDVRTIRTDNSQLFIIGGIVLLAAMLFRR